MPTVRPHPALILISATAQERIKIKAVNHGRPENFRIAMGESGQAERVILHFYVFGN